MNRPLYSTALVLGLATVAWVPHSLRAQTPVAAAAVKGQPTTSDTYLQGYLTMLEGDKMRKAKDFVGAYFKYRDSRDTFDAVHAGDPGWNVEIIDYRRRKIRESMEEVRAEEVQRRADGGAPSPKGILGSDKSNDPRAPLEVKPAIPAEDPATAPRNPGALMDERLRTLQAQISRLERRNEEILKENGAKQSELLRMGKDRLTSEATEKALKQRLIDAEDKLKTADQAEKRKHQDLIKKVAELEGALTEANARLTEANGALEEMRTYTRTLVEENKKLKVEREELTKEREQIMALLNSGDGLKAPDKIKMLAENQRLKQELAAAQLKMTKLSAEKETDRAEITKLKDEVRTVQDSLTAMQQENEDYRQQIASLTRKLDTTSKMLAESGSAGAIPESEAVAENNVLREIILQQLKQQGRRERARQNLMDELAHEGVLDKMKELGVESETLLRSVNEMAAPVVLSKEQRDIITSTQVNKLLQSPDGKELYIVEKSDAEAPSPGAPPPTTGASDKAGLTPELKAYANAAEEQFKSGDYAAAENQFRKILLVEPQNIYALCNLGVTQLRMGNNEEASETLLKAQARDYEIEFPHYARGVALLRLGRLDDAVEEISDALKINEKNAAAWHTLGVVANKRSQHEVAKQHFLKAVEVDPHCAEAHYNLAVIFATSNPNELDTARKHYKLAISSGGARSADLDKLLGMR